MTLNSSGPISIGGSVVGQSINLELALPATTSSNLNQTNFRTLAAVPSGVISLSNFYGKTNVYGAGYRLLGHANLLSTQVWATGGTPTASVMNKFSFVTETESNVAPFSYPARPQTNMCTWNYSDRFVFATTTTLYYGMPFSTETSAAVSLTGIAPPSLFAGVSLVDSTGQVAYTPSQMNPLSTITTHKTPNATLATTQISNTGVIQGSSTRISRGMFNAQSLYSRGYWLSAQTGSPPTAGGGPAYNTASRFNYPTETQDANALAGPFAWTNTYCTAQLQSTTNGYSFGGYGANVTAQPFRNTIYKLPFATETLNTGFGTLPIENLGPTGYYTSLVGYSVSGATNPQPQPSAASLTPVQSFDKFPFATETRTTVSSPMYAQYSCLYAQSTPQNATP